MANTGNWPRSIRRIVSALYRAGNGVPRIEKLTAIPHETCYNWLRSSGEMRTRKEAGDLKEELAPFRHVSFASLALDSAWILGLVYSDGQILHKNNGFAVYVGKDDVNEIGKIRHIFCGRGSVYYNNDGCYRYTLGSKRLCRELTDVYGLDHNKTYSMLFPELSANMLPHFVRGLYDGDGSWFRLQQHKKYDVFMLRSSYTSASGRFVESLRSALVQHVGIKRDKIRSVDRRNKSFNGYQCSFAYVLELGHQDSCLLGEWMYQHSSDSNRYARKHDIFRSLARPVRNRYGHA